MNAEIWKNTDFQGGHFENPRWPLRGDVDLILHYAIVFPIHENVYLDV